MNSENLPLLQSPKYPKESLGPYWLERLRTLRSSEWYPVGTLLELQAQLIKKGGHEPLVELGRRLCRDSGLTFHSAGDLLFGLDAMYRRENRGHDGGGWEVVRFGRGFAELRKTTPRHCAIDEGFLYEALHALGAETLIIQETCVQTGATHCELELRSPVRDHRWTGLSLSPAGEGRGEG